MKLKIVCPDGIIANAKVMSVETNEVLEGVRKVFIYLDADKVTALVSLDLVGVDVEVVAELKKDIEQ